MFRLVRFALVGTLLGWLPARAQPLPVEIHAILSVTGYASFLGKAEQDTMTSLQKAVNDQGGINGRPLRFVFHDDQTRPELAVQIASEILARRPAAIIGPTVSAACNAIAPLLANGPVNYCLSPGIHPPAGSYVFTASVSTRDLAETIIRYFRLRGWTRLVLLTSTDASGQDAERGVQAVMALAENKDVKLIDSLHFATSDVSVAAQIETIRAEKPQAIIAWSTGAPIATVFRGLRQGGIDLPVATTDGNMTHAQMRQYAEFLPKDLYFPSPMWMVGVNPAVKLPDAVVAQQTLFAKTLEAAGQKPEAASELGWEGPLLIVNALRKLGKDADAAHLREALAHTTDYDGIDGTYNFVRTPQRGLDASNAVVTRWDAATQRWIVVGGPTGLPLAAAE
jgi:branched-chain amino acid transport system substrate-binding protein